MELFSEEKSSSDSGHSNNIILKLAELGMAPNITEWLLDFANSNDISESQKCYLLGPIVQHSSPWQSTTPKWMFNAIFPERAVIINEEIKGKMEGWKIGPTELATALYPATMESPMSYELSQIYLWAGTHARAAYDKVPIQTVLGKLDMSTKVQTMLTQENGDFYDEYKRLCSTVRENVIKQYKKQRTKVRSKKIQQEMQGRDEEQEHPFELE